MTKETFHAFQPDTLATMKRRADSSRSVYDSSSSSDAVVSVNQKILEVLTKSSTAPKPGIAKEERTETSDFESKTAVSQDRHDESGGSEVRKEDDVKDLEEWLDDFLDE